MTKKMHRPLLGLFCFMLIFSVTIRPAYAADEKTLTYDYYFEADDPDNISYPVDKEIEVDGKHYRLKELNCDIYSGPMTEKKIVKSKDKSAAEYITKDVFGTEIKLYAPNKIDWQDNTITYTEEYKTEEDIPNTVEVDGRALVLKASEEAARKETVTTTAKFYSDSLETGEFEFNGKTVVLSGGQPKWNGWADDYADYLGIKNNNEYSITDSKWNGKAKKQSDGTYIRTATIYGTKNVNYWVATYGNADDDAAYSAEVTYTSKSIGHAKAVYERYITTKQKLIYAGLGIGLLALLSTLILFFLKRRREEDEENPSIV